MSDNLLTKKTGVAHFKSAFGWSMRGFYAAFKYESAFRQEAFLSLILVPLGLYLGITAVERALLVGSVLLVLIVELLNSSVEAAIDRIGLERHELSGRSKDLGSAAVFMACFFVVCIWGVILIDRLV